MNNGFNGYCEWLGIDTHGQLISFYRLLDLPEFETDCRAIESAAAERVRVLEPHMTGSHRDVAGRIINELLTAKRCLCDPKLKAAYDAKLQKLNGAIPSPPTTSSPTTDNPQPQNGHLPTAAEFFASASGIGKHTLSPLSEPATIPEKEPSGLAQPDCSADEPTVSTESPAEDDDLYQVASAPNDEASPSTALPTNGQVATPVKENPGEKPSLKPTADTKPSQLAEFWTRLEPHHQNLRYAGLAIALLFLVGLAVFSMRPATQELEAKAPPTRRPIELTSIPTAPLTLALPPEQAVREHQELSVPLSVANAEAASGSIKYTLLDQAPADMFIDPQGKLRWTPGEEDGGRRFAVRIRATTGGRTADVTMEIRVEEVNEPPVLQPVSDLLVDAGQEVYLQLSATDVDLPVQPISYEMLGGPRAAKLDANTGVLRFQVPKQDAGREHLFVVRARDGVGVSPQQQFVVRVKPEEKAPPVKTVAKQNPPKEKPVAKPAPPEPVKIRHSVPEQTAIQAADQLFRETFARDLERATGNEAKSQFAEKLLDQAGRLTAVPAEMYVLLQAAADLAVEAGNAPLATRAADLLADNFELLGHQVRAGLLMKLGSGRNTRSTADQARLVESAIDTVKLSIAADDLKIAQDMALLAVRVANSANNGELLQLANEIKKEILILDRQFPGLGTALISAEHPGAEPATCGKAGSWLCLVRGDWSTGLPLIAQGDDLTLKSTAALELANPADPMQQVDIADLWWEQAENSRGIVRWQLRRRAAHWYKIAQPDTQGLIKQKLAIRIEEAEADVENPLVVAPTQRKTSTPATEEKESPAADSREFAVGGSQNLLQVLAANEKFSAAGFGRNGNEFASLGAGAKLPLPAIIDRGASYEVDLEFSMTGEGRTGLAVILPLGKNAGAVVLTDEQYRGLTQLVMVDKQQGASNPTATKGRLRPRKRTKSHIKVQVDESDVRVLVTIDGTPVIDWRGSQSSISSHKLVSLNNDEQLGLWAAEPGVVFHKVNFTLRNGTSSKPR